MRRLIWVAVLSVLASACLCSAAAAATLEPIGTFQQPIFVTSDPDNPDRLLIAERKGTVIEVDVAGARTFADLTALISCCDSERGLLSIALAPDFESSGRFYAAYTGKPIPGGLEGDVHVDSFRPDPSNASQLLREQIISIDHSQNANHNGGQLQFGPDGDLYISLGDGGSGGDPLRNGQNTEALLGKVLRIEPRPGQEPPYAVPADNPFVGAAGRDEIWAYGLRNPWRFSFDREDGDMVIADVGQIKHEEIDFAPSPSAGVVSGGGANYGWSCLEGFSLYTDPGPECGSITNFAEPVFDYPHEDPGGGSAHGCSIIGGYVVRDPSVSDLYGRYVYSDFCSGEVRSLLLPDTASGEASGDRPEGLTVGKPSSFGEDSCGRVYVASDEGPVYRIVGAAAAVCPGGTPTHGAGGSPTAAGSDAAVVPTAELPPLNRGLTRLRLDATDAGARVKILARLTPCADRSGDEVQLNRGGRRFTVKRLDARCVARFFVRVKSSSTFRALLSETAIRSRPLAVEAPVLGR